jgi:hypothetical protein
LRRDLQDFAAERGQRVLDLASVGRVSDWAITVPSASSVVVAWPKRTPKR